MKTINFMILKIPINLWIDSIRTVVPLDIVKTNKKKSNHSRTRSSGKILFT